MIMSTYRVVTISPVNIRKGPGIVFDEVECIESKVALVATEFKKDAANIGWYKVDKGWVCSKYVSLAKDIQALTDKTEKKGGPRSAGLTTDGVTSEIVKTGKSVLSEGISESVLGTNGENYGSLTLPEDSMEDRFLSRRIYGLPYQFRDTVDMRLGNESDNIIGIGYREAMSQFPIISFLPGKPSFLPDLNEEQKQSYLEGFSDKLLNPLANGQFDAMLKSEEVDMKFFSFEPDYTSYIRYVNTLCWMFSIYLGIGSAEVPGEANSSMIGDIISSIDSSFGRSMYRDYHYGDYRLANYFAGRDTKGSRSYAKMDDISTGKVFKMSPEDDSKPADEQAVDILKILLDEANLDEYYTDFYINPNISYSETFSNGTKPSMLAGMVQGASEFSKEIAFLFSAGAGENIGDSQQALGKAIESLGAGLTGGNGIIQRMLSGVSTIISGANLVFPEIWMDSNFSRSFNIEITLRTPYGNPESIFTDILIPMAHWICLAAPRQASINTYGAPFLIKFHIPGFCSIDMGIVESLTITKGGDGSAWSVDGLPLEVQLSINIKDLYSALSISRMNGVSFVDAYNTLWNTSFIDYVAVQSGMDMKQNDAKKRFELAKALIENQIEDTFSGQRLIEEIKEKLATTISGISKSGLGTLGRVIGGR